AGARAGGGGAAALANGAGGAAPRASAGGAATRRLARAPDRARAGRGGAAKTAEPRLDLGSGRRSRGGGGGGDDGGGALAAGDDLARRAAREVQLPLRLLVFLCACSQSGTGVLLTVDGPPVDKLAVSARGVTREVEVKRPLPATLLAELPDEAARISFEVVGFLARAAGKGDLAGVWGASPSSVFLVGAGGALLTGSGTSFTAQSTPAGSNDLFAVWGTSAADVYVAGAGNTVMHLVAGGWVLQTPVG